MKRIKQAGKYLIFSVIPLLLLLLLIEIGGRAVYYQRHSPYSSALLHIFTRIRIFVAQRIADRRAWRVLNELGVTQDAFPNADFGQIWQAYKEMLASPEGKAALDYFQQQYVECFARFVAEVNTINARLLVLNVAQDAFTQKFFQQLTAQYHVDFLDASGQLRQYPADWVQLFPEDSHLSRLGHRLIAEQLSSYIDRHKAYRSAFHFQARPARFGNLQPDSDALWEIDSRMPYKVVTNSQGLRMEHDLTFPKTKQRILLLGDSYTFGPFLPNPHIYSALLQQHYPDKEVINAGVMGYTIVDELKLFQEKAKYVEPDIVVLQVYNNDLRDFSFLKQTAWDSHPTLSPAEAELIQKFTKKLSQQGIQ